MHCARCEWRGGGNSSTRRKFVPNDLQRATWSAFHQFGKFTCGRRFGLLETLGLEIRLHKQVTHTQRHMNNAWSEMVSSTPCLALYSSWSPRLLQTIWDNSAPTTDQPCRLITTLLLLVLHVYHYKQPNAPLSTVMEM